MHNSKAILLFVSLLALMMGCISTKQPNTRFYKVIQKKEDVFVRACKYIIDNNIHSTFLHHKALSLDSIADRGLWNELNAMRISTIYIHNKKIYDQDYPQDSSIVFAKTYTPFISNSHEYIVFSFAKDSAHRQYLSHAASERSGLLYKIKDGVYYYSY